MNFLKKIKIYIVLILVFFILFPYLISPVSAIALAASQNEEKNESWVKGIIFLLLSFIINHFISEPDDDEKKEGQISETPLIDSKEGEYEVLGFYVNWISKYSNSQKAVEDNYKTLDMAVPFWYTLNTDGTISERYEGHQHELSSLTKKENIALLPLINNNQQNNMMLVNPEIRKKSVNNIIELIKRYNYSGINIDFEFIPEWTRQGYTEFIKLLSQKMPDDKLLTISVFPKIDVPVSLQGAYDYAALADYVDRIVIMSYDNHWSTGPAGPIAPINWVEKNIKYALEYIPANKIMLGIANYGYDWQEKGSAQDLSTKKATKLAREENAKIYWHNIYQTPYFYYQDENGQSHEVWFENSHSTSFKLELVKKYNLKGIAIWKLGNSPTEFWDLINEKLK